MEELYNGQNTVKLSKNLKRLKMLVFLDIPFLTDGEKHYSKSTDVEFFKFFAPFFARVTICGPTKIILDEDKLINLRIVENYKLNFVELPFWDSYLSFIKNFPFIFIPLLVRFISLVKSNQIVWIRLHSIAGIFLFIISKLFRKDVILFIAGNVKEVWKYNPKYLGYKIYITKLMVELLDMISKFMIKNSLVTFVAGEELLEYYSEFPNVYFAIDSIIEEEDIYYRKDLKLGETLNLIYIGSFIPIKGVEYLIYAIKKLIRSYNIKLKLIGTGPLEDKLRSMIEKLNLSESVFFLGYINSEEKLLEILKESDIIVIPSLYESFGRVILEAWASGVAIVATDVGGIKYLIKDGLNGLLIKPKSVDEIEGAIGRIISDKELRRKIIEEGYRSLSKFLVNKQVENIISKIITKLCN